MSPPSSAESSGVIVNETILEEKSADKSDTQIPKTAKLYIACSNFDSNFRKAERDWLENDKPEWKHFLVDGYSIDEYGKTLVYYATKSSDLALVKYLSE
jgi:hypothetical protein